MAVLKVVHSEAERDAFLARLPSNYETHVIPWADGSWGIAYWARRESIDLAHAVALEREAIVTYLLRHALISRAMANVVRSGATTHHRDRAPHERYRLWHGGVSRFPSQLACEDVH